MSSLVTRLLESVRRHDGVVERVVNDHAHLAADVAVIAFTEDVAHVEAEGLGHPFLGGAATMPIKLALVMDNRVLL